LVTRILDGNPVVRKRLIRSDPQSLEADLLLGNHDVLSLDATELARARRSIPYRIGSQESLLVTHGHVFDPVEDLPDSIQHWFVSKFGQTVDETCYAVDRTSNQAPGSLLGSQGAAPVILRSESDSDKLPDWVNVWVTQDGDAGDGNAADELKKAHPLLPRA